MTEDKSRNRRRISIDEAGLDKRRSAIQALMELPPAVPEQAAAYAEATVFTEETVFAEAAASAPRAPRPDFG
ncbi:hypothetical protein AB0J71_29555 [Nonomuraea sp. NPDC049637]|uniref:hypothetical protein n=1 Tax=Nonomuraea sp. NPDC049637 TaxID=3154356 RepID=UPI003427E45A